MPLLFSYLVNRTVEDGSKNLSCDEGDRLGAILAEVFASLAHGQAAGSDEVEDEIADRGERAGAGANATAILVHRHVTNVMQAVFDAPVGAGEMKELVTR